MAFCMPKLKRLKSAAFSARKVIPRDVRDEYGAAPCGSRTGMASAAHDKPTRREETFVVMTLTFAGLVRHFARLRVACVRRSIFYDCLRHLHGNSARRLRPDRRIRSG